MSGTQLPALPADLVERGVTLRSRAAGDEAFLEELYRSNRWEEFAATGLPEDALRGFLAQQFAMQTLHYDAHYPGAAWGVIEIAGERAGRLSLQASGDDLRVIDVALLPDRRDRGLGSRLMKAVQEQAAALGLATVSLHVETASRAGVFYRRLGFVDVEPRGPHMLMAWSAAPAA